MGNVTGYNLKNFYTNIMKDQNPLYGYQFIAEFIGLDSSWGISDSSNAANNITYYVQSANIPGVQLTNGKSVYLGTEFRTPGVLKFAHNWTCNIMLNQNLTPYKGFRRWQEECSSLYKDGGGKKGIPEVKIRLSVLDSSGVEKIQAVILEGVWCKSVGELSFAYADGGGKTITSFPIEFRFQYNYMDNSSEFDASTDPLKA